MRLPAGNTVPDVDLVGQAILPTGFIPTGAAGTINGASVPLGGLSGVTYDAANNRYYAISDDRSQFGPARFYTFTANPATLPTAGATFTNVTPLRDASGNTFALNSLDPEGIALTRNGTVFVSSEGEVRPDLGATRVTDPFVREFSLTTGQQVRSLPVPTKFLPKVTDTNGNGIVDAADQQVAGVRNNLAFESLTITPDQRFLFTATENALFQDGAVTTPTNTSPSRILQYNLVTGQPEKEYLYNVDRVAQTPIPTTAFNTNGLVDLLAIDNRGTFLALERSFSTGVPGTGNTIKIYEVSLQGATDISNLQGLNSLSATEFAAIQPVQKRLLLNLNDLNLPTGTDNIEGITFGPTLPDGRRSVVLVSDNNFSATQFTQILALEAEVIPTAAPTVETRPSLLNDPSKPFAQRGDSDDPAVWINPNDASHSLVITSVKNSGLRVYDLAGNLLQEINPGLTGGAIRYNNVDVQYGFQLGHERVDIVVASDRNNDKLAIFKINPCASPCDPTYLQDITDGCISTIFPGSRPLRRPTPPPPAAPTVWPCIAVRCPGKFYAFVNRRQTGDVAELKLVDRGNGTIGADLVRQFTIPIPPGAPANTSPQTEGMVIDQETGFLYIGQENVGIWKFQAEPNGSNTGVLIDKVKAIGGTRLTDDVEGLTIYYGANGTGYLLASSQGDSTFAAYTREGSNDFLGRFAIGNPTGRSTVCRNPMARMWSTCPWGPTSPTACSSPRMAPTIRRCWSTMAANWSTAALTSSSCPGRTLPTASPTRCRSTPAATIPAIRRPNCPTAWPVATRPKPPRCCGRAATSRVRCGSSTRPLPTSARSQAAPPPPSPTHSSPSKSLSRG